MSFLGALVPGDETVVAECRRCGTTVDRNASGCSMCDSEDIVRYEIS
ncbi:hypothetical protein [Halosimplex salinum]|nr:hypothetical protein [Halosimplex salinum]